MKIIANHAHLRPPSNPGDEGPEGSADLLLRHLDACGIDQAVVFPPFAHQVEDSMMQANRWALEEVRQHPDRLIPAGTVFPLAADILDLLQMLSDQGVRWLKIHPSVEVHDIADPRAEPFYTRAEQLGFALDYHTGPHGTRLSLAKPEKFDNLAWNHPKLRLVFEHLGGRTYCDEFAAVLSNHPGRAFGGLTSIYEPGNYLWYIDPPQLEALVKGLGPEHFIFGLDFPWNSIEATRRDLEIIRSLGIPETDKEKILGGNLSGLIRSPVKQ